MDWNLIAENQAGIAQYCKTDKTVYIAFNGNHRSMVLKSILLAVKNYLYDKQVKTVITDLSCFSGSFTVLTPWIVQVFNPALVKCGLEKNILIESKNSFTNYSVSEMVKRMTSSAGLQRPVCSKVIGCKNRGEVNEQLVNI